jgi:hypothetical protein
VRVFFQELKDHEGDRIQKALFDITLQRTVPNVFVKGKEGSVVTLYSLSGTYVGTWIINAEEKVAITDLPEGSYLCSLNNNGTRVVKRFVVL